eukprot:901224-Amphidinium_carterae.1
MAAVAGHVECVRLLLNAPSVKVAQVTRQVNEKNGNFPLLLAAHQGHVECVRVLLSASGVKAAQ